MIALSFVLLPAALVLVVLANMFYQNRKMARHDNYTLRYTYSLPLVCVFSLFWSITFWFYSAGISDAVTKRALYLHEMVILLILPLGTLWLIGKNTDIIISKYFLCVQTFLTGIFLMFYLSGGFYTLEFPSGYTAFVSDSGPSFLFYLIYTSAVPFIWGIILLEIAHKSHYRREWLLVMVLFPVLAASSLILFLRFSLPWTRHISNYLQASIIIVFHFITNLYNVRFISDDRAADYVFSNVDTPFLFVAPDGVIFHANKASAVFFGQPIKKLVEKKLDDLFLFHDKVPDDLMQPSAGTQKNQRIKLRCVSLNNAAFCELFVVRRLDRFHEIVCAIVDVHDVTERENFIAELEEERKKAEAASRAKSLFLANTSHEIRTPLNAILGMSELALREDLSPAARDHVENIRQAGKSLLFIVNDVLDLSKIEAGKLDITNREYYFSSLLNDCLSIIKTRVVEKPIEFTVDVEKTIPAILVGAEDRVRQIVINLLSNAVKYTEKGTITFSVKAEWQETPNVLDGGQSRVMLYFIVSDTGCGIREENIGSVFTEFSRFDTHKKRHIEGTGLGLSISRKLCRMMGGDITVESVYGEGSVFTAFIPHGVADKTPFGSVPETASKTGQSVYERVEVRWTAPTAKILIVDDIVTNLKVARGLLAPFECEIDLCTNGAQAVSMVKNETYDLVFMDHMMPEMDGIETTAAIRAWEETRRNRHPSGDSAVGRIPIVALTANALSGMQEMFLEKGFDGYLAKPIEIKSLNTVMEKWIPVEKRQNKLAADGINRE
ncbi:MAG: response regulator [Spirochaetaceae bacterium]|jgi:signal transduction histidine kinase/CheY-like chemotaxis protein|nr:response regulator [Spirochaetaceae bacterium]